MIKKNFISDTVYNDLFHLSHCLSLSRSLSLTSWESPYAQIMQAKNEAAFRAAESCAKNK